MQRQLTMLFVGCAVSMVLAAACVAQKPLRSPWDMTKVKMTDAAYTCPEPFHLSPDLTTSGFYSDSKSSIIDPV